MKAPSAPSATVVAASPPVNTVLPSVGGTAKDGSGMYGSNGTWTGTSVVYSYQWRRCDAVGAGCVDIPGATTYDHAALAADVGHALRIVVTGTNIAAAVSAISNATAAVLPADVPANVVLPAVAGTARAGLSLTSGVGAWTGGAIAYTGTWKRCDASGANCVDLAGSAATSLPLAVGDIGATFRRSVTATNSGGATTVVSAPSSVVTSAAPANTVLPGVTFPGTLAKGTVLTGSRGSWSSPAGATMTFEDHWLRCDATGAGCVDAHDTTVTHTVLTADVGSTLRYQITAKATNGESTTVASAATGVVPAPPVVVVPPKPVVPTVPPKDTRAPIVTLLLPKLKKLAAQLKAGVALGVKVDEASTVTGELRISAKLAKQLKIPVLVGSGKVVAKVANGKVTVPVKFTLKAKGKLARLKVVPLTITVRSVDAAGNAKVVRKAVTLRR